MATINLTRKVSVNSRKHIMFGRTPDGYLFVIRHLVQRDKEMDGFKTVYEKGGMKICDNLFHVTEETFKAMMFIYMFRDMPRIPDFVEVIPKFND